MSRIIVYTAIFGNYDILPEVVTDEGIEYYCFTDSIPPNANGWDCIYTPLFFKDNKLNSGYVKINAHLFFPWDCILVWIDSNIDKIEYTKNQIIELLNGQLIAVRPHSQRKSLAAEAAVVAEYNLDNRNKIAKWENELKSLGYSDKEMVETNFLIRDLREPMVRCFNDTWWRFLLNGSRRDQLSFNPALWYHNLKWNPIKTEIKGSQRKDFFHLPLTGHHKPNGKIIDNSFPSFDDSMFASICWNELHASPSLSGVEKDKVFCHGEFWTEEVLKNISQLNHLLALAQTSTVENYCFVEKLIPHRYSIMDIRNSWKREYFKRAILPFSWGLEIGFGHGHSAAIMLGYNPNLSLITIETHPEPTIVSCAETLISYYPTRLEVHYGKPSEKIEQLRKQLPLDKIEFVHYNSFEIKDNEKIWEDLEWYIFQASSGCKLIVSDMTEEIKGFLDILHSLALIDYIDPGIPALHNNKLIVKRGSMFPEQAMEIKSWVLSRKNQIDASVNEVSRLNNASLVLLNRTLWQTIETMSGTNETLSEKNGILQKEIDSLNEYVRKFESPVSYFTGRIKRKVMKMLKT